MRSSSVTSPSHATKSVRSIVSELLGDLGQFLGHDRALARFGREDVGVVGDARPELLELVDDLLAFECGEATKLHVEDRRGLDLVDLEQLHQTRARVLDRGGCTNEGDDLVEGVERLEVPPQDVRALLRLAKAEPRAPLDHLDLMCDPVSDELLEGEGAWYAVDQGQHVGAEVVLQLRVLEQLVEDDLGDCVALELDHQAHAGA